MTFLKSALIGAVLAIAGIHITDWEAWVVLLLAAIPDRLPSKP